MTKPTIAHSLTYLFKDDDWFWKVSVGVLMLLLMCAGIGYFFVIGYYVETVRRCRRRQWTLPEWNKPGPLWRSGAMVGAALLCYTAVIIAGLGALGSGGLLTAGIVFVLTHAFIQPFVVLSYLERESFASCFAARSFAAMVRTNGLGALQAAMAGFGIVTIVLSFGWMALIVGWPFFIVWGMLAAAAFTATLDPAADIIEAQVL